MEEKHNSSNKKLASHKGCIGCLACYNVCPVGAIEKYMANDGHIYVRVDYKKCVHCNKCHELCKVIQNKYGSNSRQSTFLGGWARKSDIRKKSTSGGIFAAIAEEVIDDGGAVVGACFDGRFCKHIVVTEKADVECLQGSKYVFSSLDDVYGKIEDKIKVGRVLFSGTPCQCAAVLSYFEKNPNIHNLLTVDLVCGGVPSQLLIEKFFENNNDIKSIQSFRSKEQYLLQYLKNDGTVGTSEKELPISGFAYELTNRFSCYNCKYSKMHRKTDLTIGDLWGKCVDSATKKRGVSLIIVHNDVGRRLIDGAMIESFPINYKVAIDSNRRIYSGKTPISVERFLLPFFLKRVNYLKLMTIYGYQYPNKNISYWIRKGIRFLKYRTAYFGERILLGLEIHIKS